MEIDNICQTRVGRKKNRKSTQSVEDETFKFFIHKSDVLARLLMDNVDELAGMSVEEIKGCLQLGADGDTVIGKETEYSVRKNDKVILDSVFDVHIPGTEKEISLVVGIEGQNNPPSRISAGEEGGILSGQNGVRAEGQGFRRQELRRPQENVLDLVRPRPPRGREEHGLQVQDDRGDDLRRYGEGTETNGHVQRDLHQLGEIRR